MSDEVSLEKKVAKLESTVAKLLKAHKNLSDFTDQSFGEVVFKIGIIEEKIKRIHNFILPDDRRSEKVKNYDTWLKLRKLLKEGANLKEAALIMDLSYSTCLHYSYMDHEQAKKLPLKEDSDSGEVDTFDEFSAPSIKNVVNVVMSQFIPPLRKMAILDDDDD